MCSVDISLIEQADKVSFSSPVRLWVGKYGGSNRYVLLLVCLFEITGPDGYDYVMRIKGDALKRWLVCIVELDEDQADLVISERLTGRHLLTTDNLDALLTRVKNLKAGSHESINQKSQSTKEYALSFRLGFPLLMSFLRR